MRSIPAALSFLLLVFANSIHGQDKPASLSSQQPLPAAGQPRSADVHAKEPYVMEFAGSKARFEADGKGYRELKILFASLRFTTKLIPATMLIAYARSQIL